MVEFKCERCVTDKSLCDTCKDNPKYSKLVSHFREYIPLCPLGMTDCVSDPAYIKCYHPRWYERLYGNKSPEEVIKENCCKYEDPSECYDDEDK